MSIVVTMDQRASRRGEDLVDRWVEELNREFVDGLELPFVATVGDELQALVSDPATVVEIVVRGVRKGAWWVGVGVGDVERPLKETAARSRGTAFYTARKAAEAAKHASQGVAVRGGSEDEARAIEASLTLLSFVIRRRAVKGWEAIDLAREGLTTQAIGKRLGISQQAASQRLKAAGFEEEIAGRWIAERLLAQAAKEGNES